MQTHPDPPFFFIAVTRQPFQTFRFVQRTQQNTATTTWSSHNGCLVINAESFQTFRCFSDLSPRCVFRLEQDNFFGGSWSFLGPMTRLSEMASAHCFASLGFCHPMTLIAARTAAQYDMPALQISIQCLYFCLLGASELKSLHFIYSCAELKILVPCADCFL